MIRQVVSRRFADPDFLNKTVTLCTLLNERWSNSLIFMITNFIEQAYHKSSQNVRYTQTKTGDYRFAFSSAIYNINIKVSEKRANTFSGMHLLSIMEFNY